MRILIPIKASEGNLGRIHSFIFPHSAHGNDPFAMEGASTES